jgi:aspartate carbamoyltransferase catalytic subunit
MYVVRESNHQRLTDFAEAIRRPVINAMSGEGHPCEVLTDAYFIHTSLSPLEQARVCLRGPPLAELPRPFHSDVTALLNAGVLDRSEGEGIVFPFEAVKIEFLPEAA